MKTLNELLDKPLTYEDSKVFLVSSISVVGSNEKNHKKFMHKIAEGSLMSEQSVFYFPKNYFLLEAINEKLDIFISAGIVNHLINNFVHERFLKIPKVANSRKPLNFSHLKIAFYLLLLGCSISFICFMIERYKMRHQIRR